MKKSQNFEGRSQKGDQDESFSLQNSQFSLPKLRFPEFRDATLRSVWLGDVTEEGRSRNGHTHSVASVMGVTKADGIVPMEARLIAADIARYKLVQHDWFAYNPMRLNIGSIARWKGKGEILVSPDYVVFKCLTEGESGIDPSYLDHFRQPRCRVQEHWRGGASKTVRSKAEPWNEWFAYRRSARSVTIVVILTATHFESSILIAGNTVVAHTSGR